MFSFNATSLCQPITDPITTKCQSSIQKAQPIAYSIEGVVLGAATLYLIWEIDVFVLQIKKDRKPDFASYLPLTAQENEVIPFDDEFPRRKICKLSYNRNLIQITKL